MQTGTKKVWLVNGTGNGGLLRSLKQETKSKEQQEGLRCATAHIYIVLWAAERGFLQAAQESPFILSGLAYLISLLISLFSASIPPHLLIYQFSEHCWNAAKRSSSLNERGTNYMQKRYRNSSKKYNSIQITTLVNLWNWIYLSMSMSNTNEPFSHVNYKEKETISILSDSRHTGNPFEILYFTENTLNFLWKYGTSLFD